MGTPHQGGSGVQLGKLLVNIASVFVAADDHILKHLERDSEWLQQQLGQYAPISGDFVTKFAFEEYATPTVLGQSIIVCHVFSKFNVADGVGCPAGLSRSPWSRGRRVDRHPRRSHQNGQVRVEGGRWI